MSTELLEIDNSISISIRERCEAAVEAAAAADADRACINYFTRLAAGTLEPGASLSEELTNAVIGRSKLV